MTLPIYYVYAHIDPTTTETIYIGHGKYDRAWTFRSTHRSQEGHYQHLIDLGKNGFIPTDWVFVIDKNLTKDKAKQIEKIWIKEHNPIYNKLKGLGSIRNIHNQELVKKAKELKAQNLYYHQIAKILNFKSAMTAWRYANE